MAKVAMYYTPVHVCECLKYMYINKHSEVKLIFDPRPRQERATSALLVPPMLRRSSVRSRPVQIFSYRKHYGHTASSFVFRRSTAVNTVMTCATVLICHQRSHYNRGHCRTILPVPSEKLISISKHASSVRNVKLIIIGGSGP